MSNILKLTDNGDGTYDLPLNGWAHLHINASGELVLSHTHSPDVTIRIGRASWGIRTECNGTPHNITINRESTEVE